MPTYCSTTRSFTGKADRFRISACHRSLDDLRGTRIPEGDTPAPVGFSLGHGNEEFGSLPWLAVLSVASWKSPRTRPKADERVVGIPPRREQIEKWDSSILANQG